MDVLAGLMLSNFVQVPYCNFLFKRSYCPHERREKVNGQREGPLAVDRAVDRAVKKVIAKSFPRITAGDAKQKTNTSVVMAICYLSLANVETLKTSICCAG
jgi:hypothetical protein